MCFNMCDRFVLERLCYAQGACIVITFVRFFRLYFAYGHSGFPNTRFLFQGNRFGGYGLILFGWYIGLHWPV